VVAPLENLFEFTGDDRPIVAQSITEFRLSAINDKTAATVAKPRPSNSIMISVRSAAWPDHKATHLADRLLRKPSKFSPGQP
jgi:hypothetical protein